MLRACLVMLAGLFVVSAESHAQAKPQANMEARLSQDLGRQLTCPAKMPDNAFYRMNYADATWQGEIRIMPPTLDMIPALVVAEVRGHSCNSSANQAEQCMACRYGTRLGSAGEIVSPVPVAETCTVSGPTFTCKKKKAP